jgi:Zn-dependent peptidase ImmA (M78 family)
MKNGDLDSSDEIEKIARNILVASKAWGKFPTPVDQIAQFAELQIERGIDLSKIEPDFITANVAFLKRALAKTLGILDRRKKTIYLDHEQIMSRKNFITLHEVGHKACSWQNAPGFVDDEISLDPDIEDQFEREASFFASGALFQLDRFDDEVLKLPLEIHSPLALAQKFGGSNHAAIRRYVERSPKRLALLVLHKPEINGVYSAKIRNFFQSVKFAADFGEIIWPAEVCGLDYPFIQDLKRGRKLHKDGKIPLSTARGELVTFSYHFFNSSHNSFVLFVPTGETIKSRTIILQK